MPRRTKLITVAVVLVLVAAGCGGDDDDDDVASTEDRAVASARDQERADAVIDALEARLEADGFVFTEDDDDDSDDFEFESEECKELDAVFSDAEEDVLPGETASAETSDFERGELSLETGVETVFGMVGFLVDEEEADEAFELFSDDRVPRCLREAFEKGMREEAEADDASVEVSDIAVEALPANDLGEESAGFNFSGSFSASGFSFGFEFALEFVRVGRAALGVMVVSVGPPATVDRAALLDTMAEALDAA